MTPDATTGTTTDTTTGNRTFTVVRSFAAPRELVFAAFSECRHLKHWWAPAGWDLPVCEMDFRVGGRCFYCMRGPGADGREVTSCGTSTYREIDAPARIVYTDAFVDGEGNPLPDLPVMEITVTFEEVAGGTRVASETVFASEEDLEAALEMGMEEGVGQSWDKLDAYLRDAA